MNNKEKLEWLRGFDVDCYSYEEVLFLNYLNGTCHTPLSKDDSEQLEEIYQRRKEEELQKLKK